MPDKFEIANIESTEAEEPASPQWCLVYDRKTGKVLHIYQFFAATHDGALSQRDLEKAALLESGIEKRGGAAVFHPGKNARLSPGVHLKMNVATKTLVRKRIDRTQIARPAKRVKK